MKWDCGKRTRKRLEELTLLFSKAKQWHDWFAWYPVRLADNDCRWLEKVQQRLVTDVTAYVLAERHMSGWCNQGVWEYRAIE